jgi:hypothetical protein
MAEVLSSSPPRMYTPRQSVELAMLTLVLGREAGNQEDPAMIGVACSIRNRVRAALNRWGKDWESVIEHAWQYSSVEGPKADPNLQKYPNMNFAPWPKCLYIAELVYSDTVADTTQGAQSYFDKSLDGNPPTWSTDGEFTHTCDIGAFHFFRLATL